LFYKFIDILLCGDNACKHYITSPPQSHLGRATSLPLTTENGLARCMC